MSAGPPRSLHLVMPDSVGAWFSHFAALRPGDRVLRVGERGPVSLDVIRSGLRTDRGTRTAVFHSGHESLVRDRRVADRLAGLGYAVFCQSATSVRLGVDKFRMKAFFDRHGFPSLPWWSGVGGRGLVGSQPVIVKKRNGTQSRGTALTWAAERPPPADELYEQYADGVEYSVVVYRDAARWVTFPPIWKGATSRDLVPPWRRLRVCPYVPIDGALERRLRRLAVRIAEAADCLGLLEVEYLVMADGRVNVLEINPRISGTVRLAAMATGVPIFSIHDDRTLRGDLDSVRHAAECPYSGPPFNRPDLEMFATSRLTVAAGDPRGALAKLGRSGDATRLRTAARAVLAGGRD